MAIKESSDELNPSFITGAATATSPLPQRSPKDYVALAVATCGVGYIPLAPGTWGSLVGVVFYLLYEFVCARVWPFPPLTARNIETVETIEALIHNITAMTVTRMVVLAVIVLLLTWAGIWAATRVEKTLRRKDPQVVVIDEVAGQLLTFIFIPMPAKPWMLVVGFLLFRAFDIWKPYPARRLEKLESGLGVMSDDIVAGAYAAVAISVIVALGFLVTN